MWAGRGCVTINCLLIFPAKRQTHVPPVEENIHRYSDDPLPDTQTLTFSDRPLLFGPSTLTGTFSDNRSSFSRRRPLNSSSAVTDSEERRDVWSVYWE